MSEILAVDIGYGFTKGLTPKGQTIVSSLVGPKEAIGYKSDVMPPNGDGIELEVDGRWYFVGEQAEVQSTSASQTLDATRTGSTEQKALFYAAASDLLRPNAGEVAVVSGLPVGDFDKRNKAALRDMLRGEHVVERKGRKHTRRFEVTDVYIIPQAMGSLFALVLDRRGKLANGDLANGRAGIIDVGMLTSNFVLIDRLRFVGHDSDSVTSGMSEVLNKVAKDLRREYALDWGMQLGKVDAAVRARSVLVKDSKVDITDIVELHLAALGDTIVSKARSLWGAGADLQAIVLTGGGNIELAPYIRKAYSHAQTVDGDPQFANVTGYLRIGLRKFGQEY